MPISRKKACEQCRLAKTRCSLDPVCFRCSNRGLECRYARDSWRPNPYTRPHLVGSGHSPSVVNTGFPTESLSALFNRSSPGATNLTAEGATSDGLTYTLNNNESYHWDVSLVNDHLSTSWSQLLWNKDKGLTSPPLPAEVPRDTAFIPTPTLRWDSIGESQLKTPQRTHTSVIATDQSVEITAPTQTPLRADFVSSSRSEDEEAEEIENDTTIGIYVKRYGHVVTNRRGMTNERSLMARILLGQVQNFPVMLIRGSRLPPFIYPQCVLNNKLFHCCTAIDGTHQCLPKPLANCAILTRMFYDHNPGNAQIVWKAMYDEQRRLYEEAAVIYSVIFRFAESTDFKPLVLLQAQDTASMAKNDIAFLTVTISALTSSLRFQSDYETDIYRTSNLSQETWAIHESIRRYSLAFYAQLNVAFLLTTAQDRKLILLVLIIRDGKPQRCCTLSDTPLPSGRDLWDHEATETWALRLHKYKCRMLSNRVLTIDDLLTYSRYDPSNKHKEIDTRVQKDLVTWCESLDEFGTLVWMASSVDRHATTTIQPTVTMAPLPERAYTCKLPARKDASFLKPITPDWAKIDIVGQTIMLAELTSHFGSFQDTCRALKLQSNEVKSFFLAYLKYQQECNEGRLIAQQWGRDHEVTTALGKDIPQQRPLFVAPSSIAPACDFLHTLGYQECVGAVQSWARRVILWPPNIDVSDASLSNLDQYDIAFPQPREERRYSRYMSALQYDTRARVALVATWAPKEDGTPDTRMSFINVPAGSMAYGPRGSRELPVSGRYYICWSTMSLFHDEYHDLVLANNVSDTQEAGNNQAESPVHDGSGCDDVSDERTQFPFDEIDHQIAELQEFITKQGPLVPHMESTVNPKDIFGSSLANTHMLRQRNTRPFHSQTEPQGPLRSIENPQLQRLWDTWPGEVFQFRLPPEYTIIGPQGHILTFDPSKYQSYDNSGSPQGLGGTYFIVSPSNMSLPASFKMEELPTHVALRFKTCQPLVIVRNGMVLPHFVEPGVQEWSIREGFLDLYGAHGCYNVHHGEAHYNIFPGLGAMRNPLVQEPHHNHGLRARRDNGLDGTYMVHNKTATANPALIREALKIRPPQKDWLHRKEDESLQVQQDAEVNCWHARDTVHRHVLEKERAPQDQELYTQESREEEEIDTTISDGTAIEQDAPSRRLRKKRAKPDLLEDFIKLECIAEEEALAEWGTTPDTSRRKRKRSEEDDEYAPTRPNKSRTKKTTSAQKNTASKKPQQKASNDPKGTRPVRASATRKPIGPLLDAIQANQQNGTMTLTLSSLPKSNNSQAAPSPVKKNAVVRRNKISLRIRAPKPPAASEEPLGYDPDETEDEEEQ
ncbi:hypothetical protein RRF57_008744 [Xylaria bambusicola]|uniref:Zn(2)-C6 fungal-type domain-containing protein n=1 Tax=Xylaria bambusicola TaxID=326684 RepID=A0AAN7UIE1_9PEZI